MIKLKSRNILLVLGVIVLVIGSYLGWQMYHGQQMTDQYIAEAQKLAEESVSNLDSTNSQVDSNGTTPANSPTQQSPAQASPNTSAVAPQSSGSQPNSSAPASPSGTTASADYKQLMSKTYQQTLQEMQNVKSNTLALEGKNLSLSAYKASILKSQATFAAAEAFVRANPPKEERLNASYKKFLTGIILAKGSMGVVLNGISSFNSSTIYAAREMGQNAYQQVVDGYSHF